MSSKKKESSGFDGFVKFLVGLKDLFVFLTQVLHRFGRNVIAHSKWVFRLATKLHDYVTNLHTGRGGTPNKVSGVVILIITAIPMAALLILALVWGLIKAFDATYDPLATMP